MKPRHNRSLLPLLLVIFLDSFGYFLVMPVLLRLFIDPHTLIVSIHMPLSTREWLYSIALMLSPLAFIIFSPMGGHLSDRWGRKQLILISLGCAWLGFFFPIIGIKTHWISLILLGRFISGMAMVSQPVAQAAITDFSTGTRRAINMGWIGVAMTLALVIGPLLGGYLSDSHLVSWFNTSTPYLIGLLIASVNLVVLWLCVVDSPAATPVSVSPSPLRPPLSAQLIMLLMLFFLLEIIWSLYYQSSFLFLHQSYHVSIDSISVFGAYTGCWMALGLIVLSRFLLRHIGAMRLIRISLSSMAVGCLGLWWWQTLLGQWLCIIPVAVGVGCAYPVLLQQLSEGVADHARGWILGIASTLLGLAWMLTGLFSAKIISYHANGPAAISFCIALLALILNMSLRHIKKQRNAVNT